MVNEVVQHILTNTDGFKRDVTVASGVKIPKGTVMSLTDPNTGALSSIKGEALSGISSMEKSATDFSVTIANWTDGVFKVVASGAIGAGAPIMSAGHENYFMVASAALIMQASGASVAGYSLETVADDETFLARLRF